ncbi:PQQ-dependent sugar dehydrogenase, partial [Hyphococcus sp.]
PAQDRSNTLGAVVRLNDDGSIPQDNPFVGDDGAEDAIWSYGHRNIEAAAIDPKTGQLWIAEMGPLGGDEFNAIEKGANYGWPTVSKGRHYSGENIPDPSTRSDFHEAALYWTPVISPSGMVFYEGDAFPEWRGDAFIGALSGTALVRVETTGETAREAGRIPLGARIRDVVEAADGSIYVLTNSKTEPGNIWRLAPLQQR